MKRVVGEAVAYQCVWFAAVIGAGAGLAWPGVASAAALAAWQVGTSMQPVRTGVLGMAGLAVGLLVEASLAASGLVAYAATAPLPAGGPSPWILALWAVFAMSLHTSMAWAQRSFAAAAVVGGIGAPLAYLAAARGWQAVELTAAWASLAAIGCAWAVALPTLAFVAARRSPNRARNAVGVAP